MLLAEPNRGYCFRLGLTPDRQRFAALVERTNNRGNPDPKIELRNANNGQLIWTVEADRNVAYGLTISPDGKFVASLEYDAINLRDIETGKLVRTIALAAK
jgi:hypothetical protein